MLASSWWYLVASLAASWYGVAAAAAASENGEAYNETERGGRICRSVDIRNFVVRFERLRGCRVVEGFIQVLLVSIQEEDFGNLSFPELHEVTDYVLLYRVKGLRSLGQLFPNLKVIRGKQLFHNYALVVYEMPHLQEAGLHSLKVISRGGVRIEKNPALCYVRTVDWNRLSDWEHFIKDNKKERECPECQQCDGGLCWNNLHCQIGAVEDDCHETCLGGCTGPGPQDCLVCKDIFVDGACTTSCPPNRFEYMGRRCVTSQQCRSIPPSDINQLKECEMESSKMKKWIPFAGRCTQGCPSGYQIRDDTECVPCVGHCHKFCGEGGVLDVSSIACIQSLRECTYINGSLSIQLGAGGPTIMEELEEISVNIEEIDGFLKISRSFPLVSLNFLKNLKVIHGNQLEGNKSALIVWDNPKLERLWLWDNMSQGLEIRNGRLLFHDNPRLCISEVDKLQNITGLSNYTNVEVARESNGDRAICNSISLNVTLSIVNSTSVLIQWSNLEYSGKQTLLGYKVHYKEAPTNVSVDDLDEESCWGDNWKVNYIMINSDLQDVNRSSETIHVIGSLKAYTRYAYFVESYTTAWEIEGVQTPIQYFTTHPYRPYIPRRFKVHPKSSSELILSWEPPLINNGRLTHYIIAGKFYADSESSVVERDFCEQTMPPYKPKVTPPPNTLVGSPPPPVNRTCCEAEEKRICTHDDDNQQFNFIFQEGTAKPDKELCGQPSTLYSVLYSNGLFADEGGIENYQTMYGAMFNNESEDFFKVENPIGFNYTHNTTGIKAGGGTYVYFIQRVNANSLSTTLTDLRHFSEYSLKIVACRAPYENEPDDNWFRVRCSPAGLKHARTRSLYGADDINSTTVVVDIPEKWSTSVRVTWEPPLNPNGLVLNYDVVYRRTDIEHHVPIKLCVSRDRFEGLGRWVWLRNVPPGDYEVRVRAISLYGSGGFTSPIDFKSRRPEFDSTPSNLIIAFSCIGTLLAFGAVFGVLMWRKLKREKMKQKLLYTIANPEYISLGAYVEDEWEVVRDKIELVKELSRGSFGTVYEGILYPAKVRCAVKTVNDKASISERLEFLNEASVMKSFTEAHHVVKLLGVVSRGQPPLVIMELMTNGDLKTYLRSIRGDASREPKFERLIRMSVEIADGMAYLEASKFVHRDLAARNCMVAEDLTVKIGDFGMTRDIYETDYYRKESKGLVPVRWMSPESLADGVFTEKSDVWSYGVVLWEISTLAEQPYQGMSNEQVMQFVLDGGCLTRPVFCHPLLHHLMAGCWRKKPTHRPTFIQILGKFDSSATMRSVDDFRQVSFFHSEAGLELWSKFDLRAQEDELIQLLTNSDTSSSSGGYFQP